MRAFLCHSSVDKPLVDAVAQRLGRAFVLYDKFNFDAGTNFLSSIEAGLQASTLFCFFLSANSIKSSWVKHELSEAHDLFIRGHLRKIIVIVIDDSDINTIPSWLKQARIIALKSASQIEREIRYHLSLLLRDEATTIFVGRHREIELAEKLLAPVDTLVEPHTHRLSDAAAHLELMDKSFGRRHHDIRFGLRCKYEIARGNYRDALGLWNRLRDKKMPVHLALKYSAIVGLSEKQGGASEQALNELTAVKQQLQGLDLGMLDREFASISTDR